MHFLEPLPGFSPFACMSGFDNYRNATWTGLVPIQYAISTKFIIFNDQSRWLSDQPKQWGFNLKVAGINLLQLNIDSLNIEHCAFKPEKPSD